MNLLVLAGAACAYAANQWLFKSTDATFFHFYFNDVVAGLILLAWSNLIAASAPRAKAWISSVYGSILILAGASIAWEVVAPLALVGARGDLRDVACYFAGGALYGAIVLLRRRSGSPLRLIGPSG